MPKAKDADPKNTSKLALAQRFSLLVHHFDL
jgi:hypothetical protein